MIKNSTESLRALYKKVFPRYETKLLPKEVHVSAPGRINIIGEHTDYSLGHILSASIDKRIYCSGALSQDDYFYFFSGNTNQFGKFKLEELGIKKIKWMKYVKGVVNEYIKRGYHIDPFILSTYGKLPVGVGVGSSASLEVAIAKFISELFELNLPEDELIDIAWGAENNFVGVKCGIMDQLTSVRGKDGNLIHLDCMTRDIEYIKFPSDEVRIILIDSLKKHSLARSKYNTRIKECNDLLGKIKSRFEDTENFRGITREKLNAVKNEIDDVLYKRGLHYIEENERVIKSVDALRSRDLEALGEMMFESHKSLSENYDVSTKQLNELVELARTQNDICYGSRLMGAGFGGVTINLVKSGEEEKFIEMVAERFYREIGREDDKRVILCNLGEGVTLDKKD